MCLFINIKVNVWNIEMTSYSFARAAITIQYGNWQENSANNQQLLTSLETLTAQVEAWNILEKDLILNRVGNMLWTYLWHWS